MDYYLIEIYNKSIREEDLILEMIDTNDNQWLINYGIELDETVPYVSFTIYGESELFFQQDIIRGYMGIYLISKKFQDIILHEFDSDEIQFLSFKLLDKNQNEIDHNYKIINFLQTEDCLNWKDSYFKTIDETKKDYIFLNPVFDDYKISKLNKGIICVDCEKSILVSEDIKNQWDKLKLKSLAFSEIG